MSNLRHRIITFRLRLAYPFIRKSNERLLAALNMAMDDDEGADLAFAVGLVYHAIVTVIAGKNRE